MGVAAFTDPEAGYLCDNTATFSASFHIIKESSTFNRSIERGLVPKGRNNRAKGGPSELQRKTRTGERRWRPFRVSLGPALSCASKHRVMLGGGGFT